VFTAPEGGPLDYKNFRDLFGEHQDTGQGGGLPARAPEKNAAVLKISIQTSSLESERQRFTNPRRGKLAVQYRYQCDSRTSTLRPSTRTRSLSIGSCWSASTMSSGDGRAVSMNRCQRRPGTMGT